MVQGRDGACHGGTSQAVTAEEEQNSLHIEMVCGTRVGWSLSPWNKSGGHSRGGAEQSSYRNVKRWEE